MKNILAFKHNITTPLTADQAAFIKEQVAATFGGGTDIRVHTKEVICLVKGPWTQKYFTEGFDHLYDMLSDTISISQLEVF